MPGISMFRATNVGATTFASTASSAATNPALTNTINDLILGNLGTIFDPGIFFPGGGGSGGSGGTTTPTPTAPTPTPVGGSPIDLQILVAALPFVDAGQVIRPEYHNAVVQVLQLMARLMGIGPVSGDLMLTVAPAFLAANASDSAWQMERGVATRGGENTGANGWIPLTLPSGARVKQMIVRGRHGAAGGTWSVRLERQLLADAAITPVINVDLGAVVGSPFERTGLPTGPTLEAIDESRTVDNTKYAYHVAAELTGSASNTDTALFPVQIVYGLD